ncbi:metallophosphoesterase [Stakelama sediminis]|uniref:3',5'-cyclic AMP phosphodiesterase CpdA n=1 Tax=Stakelama sediminis TaxID=463200 RepID=A0A840Z0M9_9SPHN|nr:metallophosphoesterase [Stakelama sediminis]MBB5719538.1 3',5'-cyclic AMP phosphodiesterase CpdA [Stakelama sediminis]
MPRLFHVSDIHFGAEDPLALAWFADMVAQNEPAAILVTGDLTMRARRREFAAAARWLEALGRPVTVEVGNHDLPYFNPVARFLRPYARYRAVEKRIERPLTLPNVAVIPLKTTARFQWRLNWSKGKVGEESLIKARERVRASSRAGQVTLVTCHHPLVEAGTSGTARTHHGPGALKILAASGVDAVLSGHVHDPFDIDYPVGNRRVRLIGAGTLSERTRATRPSFNDILIDENGIDVTVQRLS